MTRKHFIIFLLICSPWAVFSQAPVQKSGQAVPAGKDFIFNNLDTAVKPGDDFFQYANGGWIRKNPIPATESAWGIGNLVVDNIRDKLKAVNEKAAGSQAPMGSDLQKIGDFYSIAMDSAKNASLGAAPLKPYLTEIDAINDLKGIFSMAARLETIGSGTFFGFYIGQDEKNSARLEVQISQGGLGLPNRDFYFSKLARFVTIRNAYSPHIGRMLAFTGLTSDKAPQAAIDVVKFETALAAASRPLQDLRDPYANYHKMGISQLTALLPELDWAKYFSIAGLNRVDSIIVGQPEFLQALSKEVRKTPLNVLKNYLKWNLISDFSSSLSPVIDQEHFSFYQTIISGQATQKPRWKRVIDQENALMGMLLGKLFIKEYFSAAAKMRYENMVNQIAQVYADRIKQLDWMSDTTKAKALIKLVAVKHKIGYPDKWLDYSGMHISKASYFNNVVEAKKWNYQDMITQYGKPVDRSRWDMFPQTYNAYYNPSNNEIVLPAAQMSIPGLKDEEIDDAVAYGYTAGSTIGHEITHGFDDQGRQFDEIGNLKSWWTAGDEQRFKKKALMLSNQFNKYTVLDSMHVNGQASLGENMADLGGVVLGLEAFKKTDQYKQGLSINGLTPVQRYFLGYALGWLYQERDESLARQIVSDVHAPAKFRVNGPMSDITEFYDAFQVKPGQAMYRPAAERARIW